MTWEKQLGPMLLQTLSLGIHFHNRNIHMSYLTGKEKNKRLTFLQWTFWWHLQPAHVACPLPWLPVLCQGNYSTSQRQHSFHSYQPKTTQLSCLPSKNTTQLSCLPSKDTTQLSHLLAKNTTQLSWLHKWPHTDVYRLQIEHILHHCIYLDIITRLVCARTLVKIISCPSSETFFSSAQMPFHIWLM